MNPTECHLTPGQFRNMAHCTKEYHRLAKTLKIIEAWLDGVRNERDRTRFEQRWNTLQDEAAELRVLILRALA